MDTPFDASGEESTTVRSPGKPQRFSKRLVKLMSTSSSPAPPDGPHHKLRSHSRLQSKKQQQLWEASKHLSLSSGAECPTNSKQGRGERRACDDDDHGEEEGRNGGVVREALSPLRSRSSESATVNSVSSSCSLPTNETNELSQQAGLGGTSTAKTVSDSSGAAAMEQCSVVCHTVASSSATPAGPHCVHHSPLACESRLSPAPATTNNELHRRHHQQRCVETRSSSSESPNNETEIYPRECGEPLRSYELPVHAFTSSPASVPVVSSHAEEKNGGVLRRRGNESYDSDNNEDNSRRKGYGASEISGVLSTSGAGGGSRRRVASGEFRVSAPTPREVACCNRGEKVCDNIVDDDKVSKSALLDESCATGEKDLCKSSDDEKSASVVVMPEVNRNNDADTQPPSEVEAPSKKSTRKHRKSSSAGSRRPKDKACSTNNTKARNSKPSPVKGSPKGPPTSHIFNGHITAQRDSGRTVDSDTVDPPKPNIAPMLLMNNLPYMGELTFDTRPRRGRKPKKADICHLISKNYGIQFPVSYTANLANTGGVGGALPPVLVQAKPSSHKSTSVPHADKFSGGGAGSSRNHVATPATSTSASPLFPAPAFCNRDVSIVPIPSNWPGGSSYAFDKHSQPTTTSATNTKSLSMTRPLMSQQTISMFPLSLPSLTTQKGRQKLVPPQAPASDEDDSGDAERYREVSHTVQEDDSREENNSDEDIPLNLCLRDKSSVEGAEVGKVLVQCQGATRTNDVMGAGLDVRWNKGVLHRGANPVVTRVPSSKLTDFDTATAQGGKRNVVSVTREEGYGKGSKSAKLSARPVVVSTNFSPGTTSSSSSASSKFAGGSSMCNLVSQTGANLLSSASTKAFTSSSFDMSKHGGTLRNSLVTTPSSSSTFFTTTADSSPLQQCKGLDSRTVTRFSMNPAAGGIFIGDRPGKQTSRKKRESSLGSSARGDLSIFSASSAQGGNTGVTPSSGGGLLQTGGTLFGQATGGHNETAEVSICKFKFTGGAKPCLQEKKMLSVDSGGNFRFYTDKTSVTASKVGKANSQSNACNTAASLVSTSVTGRCSGGPSATSELTAHGLSEADSQFQLSSLPKSAKSMSMCMSVAGNNFATFHHHVPSSTSAGISGVNSRSPNKLLLPVASYGDNPIISVSPTVEGLQQLHLVDSQHLQRATSSVSPYPGEYYNSSSNSCSSDNSMTNEAPHNEGSGSSRQSRVGRYGDAGPGLANKMKIKRKRRTRKSLMREKLEKTFKEKGFLIQTQQLESAEGATYCKFRQLRKFTRYLFRSWKDYLPDHVKKISDHNNATVTTAGAVQGVGGMETSKSPTFGSTCQIGRKPSRCSSAGPSNSLKDTTPHANLPFDDLHDNDEEADFDEEDEDQDDTLISDEDHEDNCSGPEIKQESSLIYKKHKSQQAAQRSDPNSDSLIMQRLQVKKEEDTNDDSSPEAGMPVKPLLLGSMTSYDDNDDDELQVDT